MAGDFRDCYPLFIYEETRLGIGKVAVGWSSGVVADHSVENEFGRLIAYVSKKTLQLSGREKFCEFSIMSCHRLTFNT